MIKIKQLQYWKVIKSHSKVAYNDNDDYSIVNGVGQVISNNCNRRVLDEVCEEHNKCFLES